MTSALTQAEPGIAQGGKRVEVNLVCFPQTRSIYAFASALGLPERGKSLDLASRPGEVLKLVSGYIQDNGLGNKVRIRSYGHEGAISPDRSFVANAVTLLRMNGLDVSINAGEFEE